MLIVVPVLCALLLCLLAWTRRDFFGLSDANVRTCVMLGFVLFQVLTVAVTELSSLGHHYTRSTVLLAWSAILLALAVPALDDVVMRQRHRPLSALRDTGWRPRVQFDAAVGLVVLSGMFAVLTVISLMYRPSNGDSMVYHLARVEHWIQNQSVAAFPAHFLAQVELPPLMEYNVATLHVLSGTDRMDGFVQLSAVVICVLGASELARRLGLGRRGQIVAGVLVITAPNFLLQATSTTNDDFNAAIGISALSLLTAPAATGEWPRRAVLLGMSAGLVELSKSTGFALLGPVASVLVVLAVSRVWKTAGPAVALRKAVGGVAVAGVVALVVSGPFLYRNLSLFGHVGGPVARSTIDNRVSVPDSLGNVVRQVSAQFLIGDGSGFEHALSRAVVRPLGWLYGQLGADPNDTDFTFVPNPDPFRAGDFSVLNRFEDVGGNPWHTLLVVASVLVLGAAALWGRRRRSFWLPAVLAVALCVGFLAFCMLAKWSIYANRYYVALFVAWSPLMALALSRVPRAAARLVCLGLVVACLPQLLDNYQRPLLHPIRPRTTLEAYFVTGETEQVRASKAADYEHLAQTVATSACRNIGIANEVVVEYPLWVAMDQTRWRGRIQQVDVTNVSHRIVERPDFRPCALVYQPDQRQFVSEHPGMTSWTFGNLVLYLDDSCLRNDRPPSADAASGREHVTMTVASGRSVPSATGLCPE